jgi:site-specific recombinase XerD
MIADYVEWLKPRYSQATIRLYRLYVQNFFKYLKYWYRKLKDVKEITPEVISRYEAFLQKGTQKGGEVSRRQGFFAVKNFLKWLERDDSILGNPLEDIKAPKSSRQSKRDILTREEIAALLAMPGHADKVARRDRAILELLYATAMKTGEVVRLQMADIDFQKQTVDVREKAYQSRVLPFQYDVKNYLMDYKALARPQFINAEKSPWFFLSRKGGQLDEASITRLIGKYAKKAGIVRDVSAQMLRNSRAAHLLFLGATPDQVGALLGHKNSRNIKRYEELKLLEMRHIHGKCHPRKAQETPEPGITPCDNDDVSRPE